MLINQENITSIIPQKAPFVMIDTLESADQSGFKSTFHIRPDNLFLNKEVLSESALIENIAQTCAAGFGYMASQQDDGDPKIGFIGAVTQVEIQGKAKLDSQLETTIEILNTFDAIHLIEGRVNENGKELIRCQMKIVLA